MTIPTDETILALHKKYAPHDQAFKIVYEHCQIIAEIAKELTRQNHLEVNEQLVHAAALLHDIGYYLLFDDTGYVPRNQLITHGVKGAELLQREGINEVICRIAERHTGVGLTKEAILKNNLPLPPRDLMAETPEERLIMYADKLHTKAIGIDEPHDTLGWFNRPETYREHARKFGEANAARFAELVEKYGAPDLKGLADKYDQELK